MKNQTKSDKQTTPYMEKLNKTEQNDYPLRKTPQNWTICGFELEK